MLFAFVSGMCTQITNNFDAGDILTSVVSLCIVAGTIVVIMWNIPTMASAITGGAGVQGVGRAVAQAITKGRGGNNSKSDSASATPTTGGSVQGNSSSSNNSNSSNTGGSKPLYQRHTLSNLKRNK